MSVERLREGRGVLIRDDLLTPTLNLSSLFSLSVSHFIPSRLTLLFSQQHFTSPLPLPLPLPPPPPSPPLISPPQLPPKNPQTPPPSSYPSSRKSFYTIDNPVLRYTKKTPKKTRTCLKDQRQLKYTLLIAWSWWFFGVGG